MILTNINIIKIFVNHIIPVRNVLIYSLDFKFDNVDNVGCQE